MAEMERVGQVSKNASALIFSKLVTSSLSFLLAIYINRQLGPAYAGVYAYGYTLYTMFQVLPDFGIGNITIRDVSQNHKRARKYFTNVVRLRIRLALIAVLLITITNAVGTLLQRSDPLSGPRFWVVLAISFSLLLEQPISNSLAENFIALERLTTVAYVYLIMGIVRVGVSFFIVYSVGENPTSAQAVRALVLLMLTYILTIIYSILHFSLSYRKALSHIDRPKAGEAEKAFAEAIIARATGHGSISPTLAADFSFKNITEGRRARGVFSLEDVVEPYEVPLEWRAMLSRTRGGLPRKQVPTPTGEAPAGEARDEGSKETRQAPLNEKKAESQGHAQAPEAHRPGPTGYRVSAQDVTRESPEKGSPLSEEEQERLKTVMAEASAATHGNQTPPAQPKADNAGARRQSVGKAPQHAVKYLSKGEGRRTASPELLSNKTFRRYLLQSAWPLAVVSLGVAIYAALDVPMLAWIKGNQSVGLYNAGSMFAKAFAFVMLAINMAVLPAVSVVGGKRPERLGLIWEKLARYSFAFMVPVAVIVPVIARPVLILQKHQFISAWIVVWLSMGAMCFTIMTSVSFPFFIVINRQKRITSVVLVSLAIKSILNLVLIPFFDFRGAAVTVCLSEVAVFTLIFTLLSRELHYRPSLFKVLGPPVACWVALYASWLAMDRILFRGGAAFKVSTSALQAVITSAALFAIYAVCVSATRTVSKSGLLELNSLLKVEG